MDKMLKQAGDARKASVALEAHQLSQELVNQLKDHAQRLEVAYYKMTQGLVMKDVNVEDKYSKLLGKVDERFARYTPREKVAKSMANQMKKSSGGAGAAKAKAKAKATGKR